MTSYVKVKRSRNKPIIIIYNYRSFNMLCPNVAGFSKNVLNEKKHMKKKTNDEHFDVAWTRKCAECGSDEEIRWLAPHPSWKPCRFSQFR